MPERDKTVLLKVLGVSPELRVIDVLADNPVLDLSADEVSEILGVDIGRVKNILADLESWNVVNVKTFEGQNRYSLDTSNDAVRHLLHFELELVGQRAEGGSTP